MPYRHGETELDVGSHFGPFRLGGWAIAGLNSLLLVARRRAVVALRIQLIASGFLQRRIVELRGVGRKRRGLNVGVGGSHGLVLFHD